MRDPVTRMHSDWESRAESDPLYHIASARRKWELADFYLQGDEIVEQVVDPVLKILDIDSTKKVVLEIGCGVGRLFRGLSNKFETVYGIDISETIIIKGKKQCPVSAHWVIGDGKTLSGIDDETINHVLSFKVFQHISDMKIIESYFKDIFRVLHSGGTFQVQLRSGSDSFRQSVVRSMPRFLRVFTGRFLRAIRVLPVLGDIDSWLGGITSPDDMTAYSHKLGLTDLKILPDDRHPPGMGCWLIGRRP